MTKQTIIFDMHGIIYLNNPTAKAPAAEGALYQEIPGAIPLVLGYFNSGCKIVFLSSSSTEHTRNVLTALLQNYPAVDQADFFKNVDLLSMAYFGHKDDYESWQKALTPYQHITHIYEDGEYKLAQAGKAANLLGHQLELHQSLS